MKTTINTAFSELKQYLYNYSEEAINIKINCLNNCSKHKLNSVNQIKEYHNQLLFLISYAENEDVLNLAEKEKDYIIRALKKHRSRRRDAASELGISERTLYRKIKEYDIED